MEELFRGKRAMGPHIAANIGGVANKSIQEVEPEEEKGDSDDILNTPPVKVKAFEGGSRRSKKKSATKSLVESVKRWSIGQARKSEASACAQEFYHYIVEMRARLAIANSCVDDKDNIATCMGILNAIEDLADRVHALAVQEFGMKKEMR